MRFEDILKICPSDCCDATHQYLYDAVLAAPAGAVVELGVYMGGSSMFLCGAAAEKNDHLFCIDPWTLINDSDHDFQMKIKDPEVIEACARANLGKMDPATYTIYKDYSYVIAVTFDSPIGCIFIDGCHCVECVKKDFFLWAPKMVPGGLMIFHDAGWKSVSRALNHIKGSPEFNDFHIQPDTMIETYIRNG